MVEDIDAKVAVLKSEVESLRQELRDFKAEQKGYWEAIYRCLREQFVSLTRYSPVEKITYGLASTILLAALLKWLVMTGWK